MKTIAWLAGIGTLLAGAVYMIVSLNRWEWNRALFFGLIVLIAEVGLATALILRKLGQLDRRPGADPATLATLRSTRPPSPDRFEWLKESARGQQLNVFITFLVAGGVLLSGVAWVVDQLGSKTSTPIGEERLAEKLGLISYPDGGLVVDDVTVLAQDTPGRRRRADPQAPGPPRPRSMSDRTRAPRARRRGPRRRRARDDRPARGDARRRTRRSSPARPSTWSCPPAPKGAERGQTLPEMVEALLLSCRLEVHSDLVEPDPRRGRRPVPGHARTGARRDRPPPAPRLPRGLDDRPPLGRRGRVRAARRRDRGRCVALRSTRDLHLHPPMTVRRVHAAHGWILPVRGDGRLRARRRRGRGLAGLGRADHEVDGRLQDRGGERLLPPRVLPRFHPRRGRRLVGGGGGLVAALPSPGDRDPHRPRRPTAGRGGPQGARRPRPPRR